MVRRRLPLVLCACSIMLLLVTVACGGNAASKTAVSGTSASNTPDPNRTPIPGTTDHNSEPTVAGPASRFSLLHEDLGTGYITVIDATYVLTAKSYGGTRIFPSVDEGVKMLNDWGYVDGYETAVDPEGRETAQLGGAYSIYMELHLFKTADGAKKAYNYFEAAVRSSGASPIKTDMVGNQSSAWKVLYGKVANSSVDRASHRLLFRRGNLIGIVQTIGADTFMKVDIVRDLAYKMDAKAMGTIEAIAPTPTSNYTPPATAPKASATPR